MIPLVVLLAILTATPDAATPGTATVTMSIDLQHPAAMSRVRLELASLRDGKLAVHEQLWSPTDLVQKESVPAGAYDLTIAAEGHRPVTRRIVVAAGETVSLGAITLSSLPRILGSVTANGAPVANAAIRSTEPAMEVRSGEDGRFAMEVAGQRPRFLLVEAARLGTVPVAVPPANNDTTLSPIELQPPSSVEVTVRRPGNRPGNDHDPLDIQIGVKGRGTMYWLARRTLGPRQSKATFDALGPGAYIVLVRGKGPMQQLATKLVLGHHEHRRTTIVIEPITVEARVLVGSEPLPNATAMLLETGNSTMARFTTDAGGRWTGEVWQRSQYVVRVVAPGTAIATTSATFDRPQVTITLPALVARGRVLDARSGLPVPAATLALRTQWEDKSATAPSKADAEGRFVYRAVQPGQQRLTVRAEGYLAHDDIDFELSEEVPVQDLDVRLDPGVRREITVRDRRGAPVAGANVLCGDEERVYSFAVTGEEGHAIAPLPAGGCTLYVIPESTSFALARVTRAMIESGAPLTVSLPGATGRLEIVTQTVEGNPVAGVRLLVRYNGAAVPPEVVRVLERAQGQAFRTDDGGVATLPALPLGTYELWPYRTDGEAAQILAAASMLDAPIQLNLKTGENHVSVKLRAR
jgi:carboxypeptidase family protein